MNVAFAFAPYNLRVHALSSLRGDVRVGTCNVMCYGTFQQRYGTFQQRYGTFQQQ